MQNDAWMFSPSDPSDIKFSWYSREEATIVVFWGPEGPLKEEGFVLLSELAKDLSKVL